VIFLCHLALEKILKGHVTEATQSIPAKSHDLIYLVKKAGLTLPQAYLEFIGKINTASIPTRYPEDLRRAIAEYPEPVARDYLTQTEQVVAWLLQYLR
jgi:HEPN domain-containing protein